MEALEDVVGILILTTATSIFRRRHVLQAGDVARFGCDKKALLLLLLIIIRITVRLFKITNNKEEEEERDESEDRFCHSNAVSVLIY